MIELVEMTNSELIKFAEDSMKNLSGTKWYLGWVGNWSYTYLVLDCPSTDSENRIPITKDDAKFVSISRELVFELKERLKLLQEEEILLLMLKADEKMKKISEEAWKKHQEVVDESMKEYSRIRNKALSERDNIHSRARKMLDKFPKRV